jgi:ABC-type xylose transport system permease subunit
MKIMGIQAAYQSIVKEAVIFITVAVDYLRRR